MAKREYLHFDCKNDREQRGDSCLITIIRGCTIKMCSIRFTYILFNLDVCAQNSRRRNDHN